MSTSYCMSHIAEALRKGREVTNEILPPFTEETPSPAVPLNHPKQTVE